MKQVLPLLFFLLPVSLIAQGIKGTITDNEGQPVAYANIYVPELKTGTTSNIKGQFELQLPQGKWNILFQYIGYQTINKQFDIENEIQTVHITLQPQNVQLKEIKVLASGEDPAYYVMRHAIAMAPYYCNQVAEYNCKLYLKGTGMVYKIPRLFKRKMEKEGVEKDKPFVTESLNKIHFELPDKLDQQVIAIRSTGDDHNTNPMQMITTNLYNVDDYGVVSPVGRNALKIYRFELVGVFEDQRKLINKIKVIPKAKGQGTFEGIINIVDGYWNIHSADLKFSMPMMDVTMRQIYGLVDTNTWMPTSLNFEMDLSALGFGLKYNYVASFSEYDVKLNDKLDHSFLQKLNEQEKQETSILDSIAQPASTVKVEKSQTPSNQKKITQLLNKEELSTREMYKLERLMDKETKRTLPPEPLEIPERVKVTDKAIKNDSAYWTKLRPIPLTGNEVTEFGKKDSIVQVHSTPEYQDSIRDVHRKFKISDLIGGRNYKYGEDSTRFHSNLSVSGLFNLQGLSFNTVDGFTYSLPFSFNLTDTLGRRFHANTSASYTFSRKTMYADGSAYYKYNGVKQRWIKLSAGRKLEDFKGDNSISPYENEIYSMLCENNFQKFYDKRFISMQWGTELINGLQLKAGFQWAQRSPVSNHSAYKFIDVKNREYTPNILDIADISPGQLEESKASTGMLQLTYTPKQRYRIRQHVKYPANSDFPTFKLQYEKGFEDLLGSNVNYDLMKFGISQQLEVGFDDYLNYSCEGGQYLNAKKLYAPDYTFFSSNDQSVTFSNPDNQFALPGYYQLFSNKHFIEGHANLDLDKLLLKRLPLLKGTLIREKLKFSYMTSESVSNYTEFSYGLNNIFLLLDLEFNMGFQNWKDRQMGFRVSINLQ